jgi:hypothetical protein
MLDAAPLCGAGGTSNPVFSATFASSAVKAVLRVFVFFVVP